MLIRNLKVLAPGNEVRRALSKVAQGRYKTKVLILVEI